MNVFCIIITIIMSAIQDAKMANKISMVILHSWILVVIAAGTRTAQDSYLGMRLRVYIPACLGMRLLHRAQYLGMRLCVWLYMQIWALHVVCELMSVLQKITLLNVVEDIFLTCFICTQDWDMTMQTSPITVFSLETESTLTVPAWPNVWLTMTAAVEKNMEGAGTFQMADSFQMRLIQLDCGMHHGRQRKSVWITMEMVPMELLVSFVVIFKTVRATHTVYILACILLPKVYRG